MQEWHTVTSPAAFTLLGACILGVGFMVRFLIALVAEGRKEQASIEYSVRLNLLEHPASTARVDQVLDKTLTTTSARFAENPREQRGRNRFTTRAPRTSSS